MPDLSQALHRFALPRSLPPPIPSKAEGTVGEPWPGSRAGYSTAPTCPDVQSLGALVSLGISARLGRPKVVRTAVGSGRRGTRSGSGAGVRAGASTATPGHRCAGYSTTTTGGGRRRGEGLDYRSYFIINSQCNLQNSMFNEILEEKKVGRTGCVGPLGAVAGKGRTWAGRASVCRPKRTKRAIGRASCRERV